MNTIVIKIANKKQAERIKQFLKEENIKYFENDYIIIKNTLAEKVKVSDINYIDTQDRRLCYHLTDKTEKYSKTLQEDFLNEVHPLEENPYMIFIRHGVLINLANVKSVDKRTSLVKFNNGEELRIAKSYLDEVYNTFYNLV
jgi:DNA-binding LytR/AlgR family response regulator